MIAASLPGLPAPEFGSSAPDDQALAKAIENYIDVRDELWGNLANSAELNERSLGLLATANDALRQMLNLTPGPRTAVLPPDRAAHERLRLRICDTFIHHAALEILRAREPSANRSIITAAYLFLARKRESEPHPSQPAARVG